jgi:hypothetical protein
MDTHGLGRALRSEGSSASMDEVSFVVSMGDVSDIVDRDVFRSGIVSAVIVLDCSSLGTFEQSFRTEELRCSMFSGPGQMMRDGIGC